MCIRRSRGSFRDNRSFVPRWGEDLPDTALLRVLESGVVIDANDVAESLLGGCVGRSCCEVVAALAPGSRVHCSRDCAASLLEQRGTSSLERTAIAGEPSTLTCSAMGSEVVVAIHPTGGSEPECPLTPRELEVMELVAEGLTNRLISRRLGISRSTVGTHIEHILDKLDAKSRAEAVTQAIATGQLPRS